MQIEDIKARAEDLFRYGVESIQKTGDLIPMFHLIRTDESCEIIAVEPPMMNDERAKAMLAKLLQSKVNAGELQAVLFLADTYFATLSDEQLEKKQALGYNVEQAAAAGLCEMSEAVMVAIDSPIFRSTMRQTYSRDANGKVISLGPRVDMNEQDDEIAGRMIDFFKRRPAAAGRPA